MNAAHPVLLTATDLSRWFGISNRQFHTLVSEGRLHLARDKRGKEMRGKYDAQENVLAYSKHLRGMARRDYSEESEFTKLRNAKMATEARMSGLKLRVLEGELIEIARVRLIMSNLLGAVKNHIRSIPARVGRLLLGLTSLPEIIDILQKDVDTSLREVTTFDMDQLGGKPQIGSNGQRDPGNNRRTKKKKRRTANRT